MLPRERLVDLKKPAAMRTMKVDGGHDAKEARSKGLLSPIVPPPSPGVQPKTLPAVVDFGQFCLTE
jgi:hypothetical protein